MKLLLDQNLSHRLLDDMEQHFPGSTQVRLLGLERESDAAIWKHAQRNGFCIVTKDSDFAELSMMHGMPPKIIWLKCGNASNNIIRHLLRNSLSDILRFHENNEASCLEIYPLREVL